MGRTYVCNTRRSLKIREHAFKNGLFVAPNKDAEKLIESNDWYGVHIFRQDDDPDPVVPVDVTEATPETPRMGRRGSGAQKA